MRRILFGGIAVLGTAAFLLFTLGSSNGPSGRTYRIELDNAYDLVKGGEFKVAGVNAGSISSLDVDPKTLHAVVTVTITQGGFGQFRSDAFCEARPQSLIGEFFVDCQPGTKGKVLKNGATIPASHTQSTIPADLVQNIMRLPYRQRFTLIINELGAAVAARSEDLQTALRRADPALTETDNLLALLAHDAQTIKQLNVNANSVIGALARNNQNVKNFIVEANKASVASATQAPNITATWNRLPAFLEQLRPALRKLGAAADAQDPVLVNLNAASSNLTRFFHDLVPFSHESVPSLRSLGNASVTGRSAVSAATPTIKDLNQFAKPTPELAQNLAIVLHDLDNRKRAAEPDLRSPGGKGYTGLESVIQYAYNITEAISYFGPFGHMLGVDAFANNACSPYATPQTIANNIKSDGLNAVRSCYAFLGPNQPGVNEPDPTWSAAHATGGNPSACVPDPGGYPVEQPQYHVHYYGPRTNACKLGAKSPGPAADQSGSSQQPSNASSTSGGGSQPSASASTNAPASPSPSGGLTSGAPLQGFFGNLLKSIGHASSRPAHRAGAAVKGATAGAAGAAGAAGGATSGNSANQAQQLLNYLLAP